MKTTTDLIWLGDAPHYLFYHASRQPAREACSVLNQQDGHSFSPPAFSSAIRAAHVGAAPPRDVGLGHSHPKGAGPIVGAGPPGCRQTKSNDALTIRRDRLNGMRALPARVETSNPAIQPEQKWPLVVLVRLQRHEAALGALARRGQAPHVGISVRSEMRNLFRANAGTFGDILRGGDRSACLGI
jgi:hypothetical protein